MNFRKLFYKFGLTKTEFNVLFILILVFLFGLILKIIKQNKYNFTSGNYIYKDSTFYSSAKYNINSGSISSNEKAKSNYKQYVLELKKSSKEHIGKIPLLKQININSAELEQFIGLPGIGEKTAIKILELRRIKGRFNAIEELMEVKGIGNSKFEKIKKFIIIE